MRAQGPHPGIRGTVGFLSGHDENKEWRQSLRLAFPIFVVGLSLGIARPAAAAFICRQVHRIDVDQRWKPASTYFMSLRTNPRHYWRWAQVTAENGRFESELPLVQRLQHVSPVKSEFVFRDEGVLAGDFHYQNMSARQSKDGLKVDFMDLDDGGRGPFAFDLVRFLVTAMAVKPHVSQASLIDAYVRGLEGEKMPKPRRVEEVLAMTERKVKEADRQYLESKTIGDSLDFVELGLNRLNEEPLEVRRTAENVAENLGKKLGGTALSIGTKRRTDGGSQGFLRVWVLLKMKSGTRIFEAKQLGDPALSAWEEQLPTPQRVAAAIDLFWGETSNDYGVVIAEGTHYWFRPRVKKYFRTDLPNNRVAQEREDYRQEMINFANYLGRRHGKQPEAALFLQHIESDQKGFDASIRELVHRYFTLSRHEFDTQDHP